ncbi:MAG TPA: hypothetical protein P5279_08715 [Anaerohalosphaeraceae bacterium]|jgi:hypothetical protein|nr:hypothetical protein [Anaerohalosphaeraceae bacterium]HRT50560.1 hypothetical protein [Anaerohalosphaeraceae bacterium]HRT86500.1 hypothetical protein [Anaerohalosphaeraceae bacterium]
MTEQARTSRVLIGLIVSMTIGAVVLMALENGPVAGGAFSLSVYLDNDSVEKVVTGGVTLNRKAWGRIEVYYSGTISGNARELAILNGLTSGQDLNAHFVVCNNNGGKDGQIERTERWELQRPCLPDGQWRGTADTIRICVVGDITRRPPTECQMRRVDELVEMLRNELRLDKRSVIWPANWRM